MPGKYSIENLRRVISDPSLLQSVCHALLVDSHHLLLNVDRQWYQLRYDFGGTELFDTDWDNFVILDAARYDLMTSIVGESRDIKRATSPASYSAGFIDAVFNNRTLHDTVYVTANPYVADVLQDGVFHEVRNLLQRDSDPDTETVPPETVIERATEASEEFPEKRLVVHFMQPHHPFLGEQGAQIQDGISTAVGAGSHPWEAQMHGDGVDRKTLIQAYRENHEIAFRAADDLASALDGRTIVTADHANLVGERGIPIPIRLYGHPPRFPHPNLTSVPVIEYGGDRRAVTAEPPRERDAIDDTLVEDRLDALGYR